MSLYRKKPVIVEAIQWTGTNLHEILVKCFDVFWDKENGLSIKTLEGVMKASVGDFIITGVNGEEYPCKPEIFHKTYEKVSK